MPSSIDASTARPHQQVVANTKGRLPLTRFPVPAYDAIPATREQAAQYLLLYEMSLPKGVSLTDRITVARTATRVTIVAGKDGKNLPSDQLLPLAARFEA